MCTPCHYSETNYGGYPGYFKNRLFFQRIFRRKICSVISVAEAINNSMFELNIRFGGNLQEQLEMERRRADERDLKQKKKIRALKAALRKKTIENDRNVHARYEQIRKFEELLRKLQSAMTISVLKSLRKNRQARNRCHPVTDLTLKKEASSLR